MLWLDTPIGEVGEVVTGIDVVLSIEQDDKTVMSDEVCEMLAGAATGVE